MFETGLSFFENKSCRTEYDKKLKQLKNHIQPKQIITYKLRLSPGASCNSKSCPLELKPAKLSDTVIQFGHTKRNENSKKKRKHRKRSKHEHKEARESKSVQTTVDDSILSGLQTVIDLCGLLEKCEEKKQNVKKSKRKNKKSRKYAEFTNHSYQATLETSTSRTSFDETHDSSNTKKFSTRNFRKLFSCKSGTQTRYTCSNTSSDAMAPPAEPMDQSMYKQSFHVLSTQQLGVPQDETQNELRNQLSASRLGYGNTFRKPLAASNCPGFVTNMTPIEEESLIYFNSSPSYCEKLDKSHSTCVLAEHYNGQQISTAPSEHGLSISRHPDQIYPTNISCLRVSNEEEMQESSSRESSLHSITCERTSKSPSYVGLIPEQTSMSENQNNRERVAPCVPSVCPKLNKCDVSNCHILNPEFTDYSTSNHCNPSTCPMLDPRQLNNSTLSQRMPSRSNSRQVTLSKKCFSPVEVAPASPNSTAASETRCREKVASTSYSPRSTETVGIDYNKVEKSQSSMQTPPRHVSIYEPDTLCNPEIREPLYKGQIECKKSRPGIPLVQPIVGFCRDGKCGGTEPLKSIRYALVKISEFMSFNTYEIMKPYKDKPKHIPTCIAEIFVTSTQKADDRFESSMSMQGKYPSVQSRDTSRRSVTGLRSKTVQPSSPLYVSQEGEPCRDASVCSSRRSKVICSSQEPSYQRSITKEPSNKGVSKASYAEPIASVRIIPTDPSTHSEEIAQGPSQEYFTDTEPLPVHSRQPSTLGESETTPSKQISHPASEKSEPKMEPSTRELYTASRDQSKIKYESEFRAPSFQKELSGEIPPSSRDSTLQSQTAKSRSKSREPSRTGDAIQYKEPSIYSKPASREETIRSREPSMHSKTTSRIESKAISDTQQHSDLGSQTASKKSMKKSSQQISTSKIIDVKSGERSLQQQSESLPVRSTSRQISPSLSKDKSRDPIAVGLTNKSGEPSMDNKVASEKSQSSQKMNARKTEAKSREQSLQQQHSASYHEPETHSSHSKTSREPSMANKVASEKSRSFQKMNASKTETKSREQSLQQQPSASYHEPETHSSHSTNRKKSSRSNTHESFHSTRSKHNENNQDTFYLIQPTIPNYKQNVYHCAHLPK